MNGDAEPGNADLVEVEVARLCQAYEAGRVSLLDALWRCVALGAEVERLEAKERACAEYDRARKARLDAFAAERGRPSSRPPKGP